MKYITVLFKKHKKNLPRPIKGTKLGEFFRYGFMIFISAWILQGVHITNWREVIIRYAIDFVLTLAMMALGMNWLLAFFIAHSINFALNGQLFAMYTHMGATRVKPSHFLRCTQKMHDMLVNRDYIDAAIAYGSLSRGCYKQTSDIDIRIIPAKKGWWKSAIYAVWLRIWAFFSGYPLDLYCYAPEVVIKKMRTDELPIILIERNNCMLSLYPERVEWEQFVSIFKEKNIDCHA